MNEIVFNVSQDEASGVLVAAWDDPSGGGITTQGEDLRDLQTMIRDAVACHFDDGETPHSIRLHFIHDPVLAAP
jgi:hypothetical protein